ncbi:MAG: hypothetical protein GYA36_21440 [Veillonellaceae bacterium]|nr:hypothetical protein [Veillonellaceae bacterium]
MLERDWAFLEVAVGGLEEYLQSSILYYPLGYTRKAQGLLQLTLGNLLVTTARLQAIQWDGADKGKLDILLETVDAVRSRWRAGWNKKAEQEIPARLNLWKNSLRDWADNHEHTLAGYRHQVRWRVILHLLMAENGRHYHEESILAGLDSRLRMISTPGDFLWEPEIEQGFSKQVYWYLYLKV